MIIIFIYLLTFVSFAYCMMILRLFTLLKPSAPSGRVDQPIISIIVAVRNGRRHLRTCLKHLLRQTFPLERREIILVDDHSTDGTFVFLRRAARKLPIRVLQVLTNSPFLSSKKAALAVGIAHSRGDILLFTDVDCAPPPEWAETMVSLFHTETLLVAGFSPQSAQSSVWSDILLLDAAAAGMAAAAGIGKNRGVTCTGRNLAYRRSAYEAVGGFAALPDTLSGDDDFMAQRISSLSTGKVCYAFHRQAVVPAVGPPNLKAFLSQKRRHLSAGTAYPFRIKLAYAVFHGANYIIWAAAAFAFVSPFFLLPLFFKLLLDRFALQKFLNHFSLTYRLSAFFLWEPLFVFYHLYCALAARRSNLKW